MKFHQLLIAAFSLLLISACEADQRPVRSAGEPVSEESVRLAMEQYDVAAYFSGDQKDTLLANMVTYIYLRPAEVKVEERTDPKYRGYYVRSAALFDYAYHTVTDEGVHYFYLIRPARILERNFRGVGGRFTVNDDLELLTFEELFNTPIMDKPYLLEKGLILFEEMVKNGNVDRYFSDQNLIQWPDHRLQYSTELREWRYVD